MSLSAKLSDRKVHAYLVGAIVLLGAVYLVFKYSGVKTESEVTINNISGGDFEITYTSIDRIAKEEFISVYISKAAEGREPFFVKWFRPKTLLFRYDPGAWDRPLPSIRASGPNKVLISIPEVSEVLSQSRNWGNVSIDYNIGRIDFPESGSSQQAP
ncbi:MAG: hypothetical protein WA766_10055 [Candidatus Acidiferrales bacterium]|jgi:hypothetical protein